MKVTLKQIREMQEMGLIKNAVNVGIKPEQIYYIKKFVAEGKFKSINAFVQMAVDKELQQRCRKDEGGESE